MEDFAAHLVEARKRAGLTQTQLASAAGLTPSYLSFIENRKKPPPSDAVCLRLATALELPAEALLERAHLERAPKELRARVQDLTSSLHREQSSVRSFLEGLLSPFLFSGPPGYADSAMDVLALSPARRRRIQEAARRGGDTAKRREQEIRKLLADLSPAELRAVASRLPLLLEGQPPHPIPVLSEIPKEGSERAQQPFILVLQGEHLGSLSFPSPGDHVLIAPHIQPAAGDLLLIRDGHSGIVRRLDAEGALPEEGVCGVLTELRTPLRQRGE